MTYIRHRTECHTNESIESFKGKSWVPFKKYPRYITYQHIPLMHGLYNGCRWQYGVIFWEQLLGYPPKGTENFPSNHEFQRFKDVTSDKSGVQTFPYMSHDSIGSMVDYYLARA